METSISETTEQNVRPQFLKVLCILSFIMCGIMLLFGLLGLKNLFMSADDLMAMNPMISKLPADSYQMILDSMQYKDVNAILALLIPVISLTGVIYMWKLKKGGFYIYLIGELLPYILSPLTKSMSMMYAMSSLWGDKGTMIINVFVGLVVVFDVLFIILYALNLKHMK